MISPCVADARPFAQGGPPLIADDPGTPGNGHWEINAAALWTGAPGNNVFQFPYLDLNYGWGDHLQLKLETGYTIVNENTIGVKTGAGTALAGVKWRFLDEETNWLSVSTYPQIDFHLFFRAETPTSPRRARSTSFRSKLQKASGRSP